MFGIAGSLIDVVQHRDDGLAMAADQPRHQMHEFNLVLEVEVGRGFIKQDHLALLCKRHGDPCALALTAGKAVERAIAKRVHARQHKRFVDGHFVLNRPAAEEGAVRIAALADEIADRQAFRRDWPL
ncbi:hypothetical protein D3C78_1156400 [compost metagenome]